MGISVWRGKFNRTQGEVALDRKARQVSVLTRGDLPNESEGGVSRGRSSDEAG